MHLGQGRENAKRMITALPAVVRSIAAEVRRADPSNQLTLPQFSTLRALATRDLSISDLSRLLHVAMPTVTQSIDCLVSKRLVERYTDARDRRQVWLHLTEEGHHVESESGAAAEGYLSCLLARLPEEQRAEIAEALEHLSRLMEEGEPVATT